MGHAYDVGAQKIPVGGMAHKDGQWSTIKSAKADAGASDCVCHRYHMWARCNVINNLENKEPPAENVRQLWHVALMTVRLQCMDILKADSLWTALPRKQKKKWCKGVFRLPIKSAVMEKFPWRLGHVRLSARYRRERFTAEAHMGGKGDKGVLTRM